MTLQGFAKHNLTAGGRGRCLLITLAALAGMGMVLTPTVEAYDSPRAFADIPRHSLPWVERRKPGVQAVFLWKFTTEEDRSEKVDSLLDEGDLGDLMEAENDSLTGDSAEQQDAAPKLEGGAAVKPDAGRFGGGLVLDGTGFAIAEELLNSLLSMDGGFTLDFWFKADSTAEPPAQLFALGDKAGRPLLEALLTGDQQVTLAVDGTERLQVPLYDAADGWHHLSFVLRGAVKSAALALTVDGLTERAGSSGLNKPVPWLDDVVRQLGSKLYIGGFPGETSGLHGAVDEVRLVKGIHYLYPYAFGVQAAGAQTETDELKSPYFRETRVLTRFRFDRTLEPDVFAGRSWSGESAQEHFQPGISGKALDLSRIAAAGFEMKGFHVLPDKEGTMEFWFRPLDWHNFFVGGYRGEDVQFHHLLQPHAEDARYGTGGTPTKDVEVRLGRAQRDMDLRWQKFHPGTWTHVLISLDEGKQTVYVNGRKQKLWQAGYVTQGHPYAREPLKKWRERTGGKDVDDTWTWRFKPSPTLIDEFSVYSRPLNAEEAWNAYARWLPNEVAKMKQLPVFRVNFDYFAHSWSLEEKLDIAVECLPVGGIQPVSADCELRNADGEILLAVEKQSMGEGGNTTFTLQRALDFGQYRATIRSRGEDGQLLEEKEFDYTREKPEWLGNTLGEARSVPEPWTPMTVEDRTIKLIGRTIDLGQGGMPTNITTLGRDVLEGPISIVAHSAAGQGSLKGRGVTFSEKAEDRVAWQAALDGVGVTADIDAWMEFDGLLYCSVTLKPTAGNAVQVNELSVEFPLDPEIATQLLANGGGSNFRASWVAKFIPEGEGRVWNSLDKPYPGFIRAHGLKNYMPHIWLGGDDRGLYFGAENDKGWTVNAETPAQEIRRQNGAVAFRMNVIREPLRVTDTGHKFHFVILPTPAKPEPPDWREQMTSGGVTFGSVDTFGGFDMKTDPADPTSGDAFRLEPRSWEYAASQAPQCRAKWGRCILYADASWPRPGPAFSDWNHDLWAGTGRIAWTPEFEDYAVWAINEFLRRGLIDGVYWDDVSVGHTYSLASTAYKFEGSENGRRVGFTALAQRRVNMRLWRLFQAAGKEPAIWTHMTVCYEVPAFSFCRYLSNCEFVTGVDHPGKRDAMDMWSPDTLRILGGSAKWGAGYQNLSTLPRQLPNTPAAQQWLYPQARTETALYLASDQWGPADGLGQVLAREKLFAGPVQAYPWWKADEVVAVTAPEDAAVRAGVYVANQRAVVIIANWDREEREVAVELNPDVFRGQGEALAWRDLDPGLEPPKSVAASAEEIKQVQAGATAFDLLGNDEGGLDDASLNDMLEGTTPESRARQRLDLRVEDETARVVVRPRDYRVLEVRSR